MSQITNGSRGRMWLVAAIFMATLLGAGQVRAAVLFQQGTQAPAPSGEQQRILSQLRSSGLSREQVRERLRQAGYNPLLADAYFDEMARPDSAGSGVTRSGFTRELPPPSGNLLAALTRIGVLKPDSPAAGETEQPKPDTLREGIRKQKNENGEPDVFGRELFAASTQFEPIMSGPVDPGYRLGPGDELTVLVTGDVELAYELTVTREGYIVIPDVGQVVVNGLTVAEAKGRLNDRLARVYSGVKIGTTQADLTVGRLRSKLVYVVGEVEVPGAYSVNGSATVFSALYRAGGPALNGSFRNIEVRRGDKVVRKVDIYNYLLHGDKSGDVLLEQGDVVFVPVVGPQVVVDGTVRRRGTYEVTSNEDLTDVLAFAGGGAADADLQRIQIDRILPIAARKPGHEHTLIDVDIAALARGTKVPMIDGDKVRIFKVENYHRNRVFVKGDVQRPGIYEYTPGMTALDLVRAANGLLETAFTPAAHIVHYNLKDNTTTMVPVVLDDTAAAQWAGRVKLADTDALVVFSRQDLVQPKRVEIFGMVKKPGTYEFSEGMTVQDLVLLAGGFTEGAVETSAEVARRVNTADGTDSLASVQRVSVNLVSEGLTKGTLSDRFRLVNGDQVFIRRLPGYQPLTTITIAGEVRYPGDYTVRGRQEKISDIVQRAGGLTSEAYANGFQLYRDDKLVAVDFPKILKRPGGIEDLAVQKGDRIAIPRYDPTVLVTGAVAFESRVRYQPNLSLSDYLSRAGGVSDNGNAGRASVRYASGELRTVSHSLGFFKRYPRIEPGSVIVVPQALNDRRFDWDKFLTKALTVMSTLATVVVAANAVK